METTLPGTWDLTFALRGLAREELDGFLAELPIDLAALALLQLPQERLTEALGTLPPGSVFVLVLHCFADGGPGGGGVEPGALASREALAQALHRFLERVAPEQDRVRRMAGAIWSMKSIWARHRLLYELRSKAPATLVRLAQASESRYAALFAIAGPLGFRDLVHCNDKGIQNILKEIDYEELALALKGEPEELRQRIFRNMSQRASELIREEMEYMGPVRLEDVAAAQLTVLDICRRLMESGDVIYRDPALPGEGIID